MEQALIDRPTFGGEFWDCASQRGGFVGAGKKCSTWNNFVACKLHITELLSRTTYVA